MTFVVLGNEKKIIITFACKPLPCYPMWALWVCCADTFTKDVRHYQNGGKNIYRSRKNVVTE